MTYFKVVYVSDMGTVYRAHCNKMKVLENHLVLDDELDLPVSWVTDILLIGEVEYNHPTSRRCFEPDKGDG